MIADYSFVSSLVTSGLHTGTGIPDLKGIFMAYAWDNIHVKQAPPL